MVPGTTEKEAASATGGCHCGAVAYAIDASLSEIYICHCSLCRRATGSGGIAVVVVNNDVFAWTEGLECVRTWSKPGHDWQTSFCVHCGSPLPGPNDDCRMYVPVGTLNSGHDQLDVAHHIHVDSRAGWEEIGDAGRQHPKGFGE